MTLEVVGERVIKELLRISHDKLHLIVDFISGMTDSYAVGLYKKLLGISLPE